MRLSRFLVALLFVAPAFAGAPKESVVDGDEALAVLKDGNARYAAGDSTFPHLDQDRRCATVEGGQHPIASVLTCADSRVPPELLFDAGVGDLFVVRVAGNVADVDEIGTLEYGAGRLGVPLIVVMGHTKCDAVAAVVQGAKVEGYLSKLNERIAPAVAEARTQYAGVPEAKLVQQAIRANVRQSMRGVLAGSAEIRELVAAGKVHVVGAVYDLHNGTIEWLGEHPRQAALLKEMPAEPHEAVAEDELIRPAADEHAADPEPEANASHATVASHEPSVSHESPAVEAEPAAAKKSGHDAAESDEQPAERPHGSANPSGPTAHEKPSPAGRKPSHDEASSENPAAHGEAQSQEKATSHGKAEREKSATHGEAAAVEAESLVKKQGLLVPGAFMAAGSALSGTLVFLLKGRRPATAPPSAAPAAHEPAPATH